MSHFAKIWQSCGANELAAAESGGITTHLAWDRIAALDRVGGDEPLLRELIAVFFEDYPNLAQRLRQALSAQDLKRLREAAHTLKGGLGYLGVSGGVDLAVEIESACRDGDAAKVAGLLETLLTEVASLREQMTSSSEDSALNYVAS